MMLRRTKITMLLVVLSFIVGRGHGDTATIARNGVAKAVILIEDWPSDLEKHAAGELAYFLREITGAEFPIVHRTQPDTTHLVVREELAYEFIVEFGIPENMVQDMVPQDTVGLWTTGGDLIFTGGKPRGTLYAVYTFLEDQLGCRWWSSQASTIPKRKTIVIDELYYAHSSPLEYREPYWFDAFDGDWAVRNKCNGHRHRLDAKRGGQHTYEGFVHTFYRLIPPEKYFEDHPEWFSEIEGKRTHKRAQLCLTNEQMRRQFVVNLKERLQNNPDATIASVSQNDWRGNCRCSKCAAIEQEEDSPAGLMLQFVNAVAEDIEQEFPNVAISTLAYQYTRKQPRITKPRHNVIVRLCSIECSFSKPLSDERNKEFRDDIVGWSKICSRLYIWDYTTNFRHHVMPHPNLRVLGPNVKFFVENNVKGIFEQGAYNTNGAEMAELRAWVLAKLLWNPTRDGQELVDEFIAGYYGPAGPHIKAYLQVKHDAVEASEDWLGCFSQHTAKFLSFETLSKGWAQLKAAEAAVRDDPDLRFRVQVAQLPAMYTFMMRWDEMREKADAAGAHWPMPDSIEATYEQFMRVARKKNITRLDEWNKGYGALEKALERAEK